MARDRVPSHKFSPTVATVSQSCSAGPSFCGDDVLDRGSTAGAETLVLPVSSSPVTGFFLVAVAPAGGSMGRGMHRETTAQLQPTQHQQRTQVRTMGARAVRLREAGGALGSGQGAPRTRVGSAGPEPTPTLFIPGGSGLGVDWSTTAGVRGCQNDA